MDTREISVIVDRVTQNIASFKPGTLLTHIVLSDMLGVDRREECAKYYNMVGKVRNRLKSDYGIFLKTERMLGYYYADPGDAIDLCDGNVTKGVTTIIKSVRDMQYIPINKIVNEEKKNKTLEITNKRGVLVGMLRNGGAYLVPKQQPLQIAE